MAAFSAATTVRLTSIGDVRIGSDRPVGLSVQPVVLTGATLLVDVADITAVPFATISDMSAASWWLPFVYGEEVTDAVLEAAESGSAEVREVHSEAGTLAGPLLRFAKGLWVHRWWPLPDRQDVARLAISDERLMEAELGAIAWFAEELFGTLDVARGLLEDNVEFVLSQADDGRLAAPRLLPFVRAAIEAVPVDDDTYQLLEEAEDRLAREVGAFVAGDWSPELVFSLDEPVLYRHAESGSGDGAQSPGRPISPGGLRYGTVSWGLVPPRTLSSREDNVEYSLDHPADSSSATVEITVDIHPESRAISDEFYAGIYSGGELVPGAVVRLAEMRDGGTRKLTGATAIAWTSDDVEVRVFSEEYIGSTPLGTAHADTPERRSTIVDLLNRIVAVGDVMDSDLDDQSAIRGDVLAPYDVDPHDPWYVSAS